MSQAAPRVRAPGLGQHLLPWVALSVWIITASSGVASQNPNPPEVQSPPSQSQDAKPTFQLHAERNLVTVKVVVRDGNDHPVGSLHKGDFKLFDDGKPQEILGFTVEGAPPIPQASTAMRAGRTPEAPSPPPKALAQRFVILFFDDFHLQPEEIGRTRNAAWRYVTTEVHPQDRVAIYTATGKDQLDFTDDREKLHDVLFRLAARPRSATQCPEVEDYEAFLADRRRDPDALRLLHRDAVSCTCGTGSGDIGGFGSGATASMMQRQSGKRGSNSSPPSDPCPQNAMRMGELVAAQVWSEAEMQSLRILESIENSVHRLTAMPGQRTLALVSLGFLTETLDLHNQIDAIIHWALHQDIVINAVDAAGLYAYVPYRTALGETLPDPDGLRGRLEHMALTVSRYVLANLTSGTGGVFFHNSNDFDDGFRQAAAVPEVYYVLTFSPPNIKLDGKFHALKVTVKSHELLSVEARRGYFATAAALAGQPSSPDELEKVVFSQEEVHGLAADVTAQVASVNERESKLTVTIHVDTRQLPFRKEGDRSVNKLIFHTSLFDYDGKYITAKDASIDLHLKDATMAKVTQSGVNAKTSFKVAPGDYRIREVVQDTESKAMSALNRNIQVPTVLSQPAVPIMLSQRPKRAGSMVDWTLPELMSALPELVGLQPAENQQDLPTLLQKIGENVKSFFDTFPNTTAREQITLQLLDWKGQPIEQRKEEFNYLDLSRPVKNDVDMEEYRTDAEGDRTEPAPLRHGFVSKGFSSMVLYFHPTHQADTQFRNLGRQIMDGHETEVILFSQIPGKARPKETLRTAVRSIPILVQGLAWVDSTSFQIIRMRTDLLRPQGDINLRQQTTQSRFTEVHFKDSPQAVWLPEEVTVTVNWQGQIYLNRHDYSDFKLFRVEAQEGSPTAQNTPP